MFEGITVVVIVVLVVLVLFHEYKHKNTRAIHKWTFDLSFQIGIMAHSQTVNKRNYHSQRNYKYQRFCFAIWKIRDREQAGERERKSGSGKGLECAKFNAIINVPIEIYVHQRRRLFRKENGSLTDSNIDDGQS